MKKQCIHKCKFDWISVAVQASPVFPLSHLVIHLALDMLCIREKTCILKGKVDWVCQHWCSSTRWEGAKTGDPWERPNCNRNSNFVLIFWSILKGGVSKFFIKLLLIITFRDRHGSSWNFAQLPNSRNWTTFALIKTRVTLEKKWDSVICGCT